MKKKVFLNGGHGGDDPGASGNGLVEKDITNFLMVQTKNEILRLTSEVEVMAYQSMEVWAIAKRKIVYEANLFNPDLFISVHVNAGGGTGFESFIHSADDNAVPMRALFHAEVRSWLLSQGVKMHDGGRPGGEMKVADFYVLGGVQCPAILTENLFIDTPADAALLKNETFLMELAEAHARGCLAALGIKVVERTPLPADVPAGHWAEDAIRWVLDAGIMKGYPDGTFRPGVGLTRAEEAAILYKTHGPGANKK
ncbi:MAG: N-acetylmuramoyl-L-alanine amidase [Peptococcaceae bacterium]|nr:N-acetylmuramoyl-L-alanine amidase [Peptococcaceae bacterium]